MPDAVLQTLIDVFRELEGGQDMALNVVKANALKTEGKSLIVYGHAGIGKTHALGTLPEGKTLVVDLDRGTETIAATGHDVVQPASRAELDEVLDGLEDGSLKYLFVAIDSLSELEKLLQTGRKVAKGKEFLSMREYGESAEIIRELMRKFRDLRQKGVNVVFTCLEQILDVQVSESEVRTMSAPMLTKKFSLEACGLVDMVARLSANPNTGKRELRFVGDDTFVAKTRVAAVEAVEPPDLTRLYRKIYGIKQPPAKPGAEAKADAKAEADAKAKPGAKAGSDAKGKPGPPPKRKAPAKAEPGGEAPSGPEAEEAETPQTGPEAGG